MEQEADTTGDGVPDWRSVRRYDADGLAVVERVDIDVDGDYDGAYTWGWDAAGYKLWMAYDDGLDGDADYRDEREWSVGGLPVRSEIDDDGDGVPESVTLFDALGRVVHYAHYRDGALDSEDRWIYDDFARTSITETDLGGEGDIDVVRL